jgi:hypothetical protein
MPEKREICRLRQENDYLRQQRDKKKPAASSRPRCSPATYADGADESIALFHRDGRCSGDFQDRFFRPSTQRRASQNSTEQGIIQRNRGDLCGQSPDLRQSTHHACAAPKRMAVRQKSHHPADVLTWSASPAKTPIHAKHNSKRS